jgi:hypothetical protein
MVRARLENGERPVRFLFLSGLPERERISVKRSGRLHDAKNWQND